MTDQMTAQEYNDWVESQWSEHEIQCKLFNRLKEMTPMYPELEFVYAVPNSRQNEKQRMYFAAEGAKPGVPDLVFPFNRCGYGGMYIEMKTQTGRVSPKQKKWIAFLLTQNYKVVVCRRLDDAFKLIIAYVSGDVETVNSYQNLK